MGCNGEEAYGALLNLKQKIRQYLQIVIPIPLGSPFRPESELASHNKGGSDVQSDKDRYQFIWTYCH